MEINNKDIGQSIQLFTYYASNGIIIFLSVLGILTVSYFTDE